MSTSGFAGASEVSSEDKGNAGATSLRRSGVEHRYRWPLRWTIGAIHVRSMVAAIALLTAIVVPAAHAEIVLVTEHATSAAKTASVAEALNAMKALDEAVLAQNAAGFSALLAHDAIVNTPRNTSHHRADILRFFAAGTINYARFDRHIELAELREANMVVFMGTEILEPIGTSLNAGSVVRRRFTDVWRKDADGAWRLTIRQATIVATD